MMVNQIIKCTGEAFYEKLGHVDHPVAATNHAAPSALTKPARLELVEGVVLQPISRRAS